MQLGITAHSEFNARGLYKNGAPVYENLCDAAFDEFIREAYRFINPGYAKFYKMDELCKLAFLAAEILLADRKIVSMTDGSDIALVLGNKHSSIASDRRHFEAYHDRENYFPSPAVFVYTLPNIMMGELCIRHQISGENACFVMDSMQTEFLFRYVQDLFINENYTHCITGWVDYSADHYHAALWLVEKINDDSRMINKFEPDYMHLMPTQHG